MEYTEIAPPPRQMIFETVTACNLRCPSCFIGSGMVTRKKGLMEWDLFCKVCDQIESFVKHVYCHLWGEPLISPHIGKMIRRAKQFATVDLSTHGLFVTEENADDICQADTLAVSMEGLDQETYEKYRVGGKHSVAMAALQLLAEKRKAMGLRINWTWVVTNDNLHQIEDAQKLADSIGNVNFGPKSAYFVSSDVRKQLEPQDEKYKRYHADGTLKANRLACREFWDSAYCMPDGSITTCCYDHNQAWVMGNVNEKTVLEIWNDEPYRAMRRRHLAGTLNEMCSTVCGLP